MSVSLVSKKKKKKANHCCKQNFHFQPFQPPCLSLVENQGWSGGWYVHGVLWGWAHCCPAAASPCVSKDRSYLLLCKRQHSSFPWHAEGINTQLQSQTQGAIQIDVCSKGEQGQIPLSPVKNNGISTVVLLSIWPGLKNCKPFIASRIFLAWLNSAYILNWGTL